MTAAKRRKCDYLASAPAACLSANGLLGFISCGLDRHMDICQNKNKLGQLSGLSDLLRCPWQRKKRDGRERDRERRQVRQRKWEKEKERDTKWVGPEVTFKWNKSTIFSCFCLTRLCNQRLWFDRWRLRCFYDTTEYFGLWCSDTSLLTPTVHLWPHYYHVITGTWAYVCEHVMIISSCTERTVKWVRKKWHLFWHLFPHY